MSNNQVSKTAEEILDKHCNPDGKGVANQEFIKPILAAMEEYASQFQNIHPTEQETIEAYAGMFDNDPEPSPSVEQMAEALKTTLEALKDLVRQLPTDENLADYRLDFAELAEQKAIAALSSRPLPQADKVEDAVNDKNETK